MSAKKNSITLNEFLERIRLMSNTDVIEVPIVDFKPVIHACWEKKTEDGIWWYACSECDGKIPRDRYGHDYFSTYCPHCGAVMDLEYPGDE